MTTFAILKCAALIPSLTNPRTIFDPAWIKELAESIKANGVIQPILARPLPGNRVAETARGVTHEIVEGECRWRSSNEAAVDTIPVMVKNLTDLQVMEIQLISFLKRKDLTALEEAQGFHRLMDAASINADTMAERIKKSRAYIYARLKLLDLCIEAQDKLRDGTIDASRALLLARIPDHKLQIKALDEITQKDYRGDIEFSARDAAVYIQQHYMLRLDRATFGITDAALLPDAGSCKDCPKRTGANPDLFADVPGADVCTDPPCYHRKEQAHTDAQLAAAHAAGQTIISGREAKELMPNSFGGIDGYLRLDDAKDSPTDKPLRKLLGKQLETDGIKPTLIDNPHKPGELIAVLPSAQVADLLKAKGHQDAAQRVDATLQASAKAEAAAAQAKLEAEYEQGWRTAVLERTWASITESEGAYDLSREVMRHIALHYAHQCNTERAKRLCKLLDLGKVAPVAGLQDYIKDCEHPQDVLQLLVAAADAEYKAWIPDQTEANKGLLLVAADNVVNIKKVQEEIKAQMRGTAIYSKPRAVQYRGPNGETWSGRGLRPRWITAYIENGGTLDSLIVPPPLPPAAQAKGERGTGPKAKGNKAPAAPGGDAPLRKRKLSADEAQAAIAAAMQDQESNPGADAQGIVANSSQPADIPGASAPVLSPSVGLAVGMRVRITTDDERLPITQRKYCGKEGTISQQMDEVDGADRWMVTFRGNRGGMCAFDAADLTITGLPSMEQRVDTQGSVAC
jgi:ParB/RepB/Spo0J family partition protein